MVADKRDETVPNAAALLALTRFHAACMATAAMRRKAALTTSPGDYGRFTKQICILQTISYKCQADYVEALSAIEDKEAKISLLYRAPSSCDVVDLHYLGNCLLETAENNGGGSTINGIVPMLSTSLFETAETILEEFNESGADDNNGTATATTVAKDNLGLFMEQFASATNSSFDDVAELVAMKVLSSILETSTNITDGIKPEISSSSSSSSSNISMIDEERVLVLFKLVDTDGSGEISFEEISASLLHLMQHNMDPSVKQVWAALLVSSKDDARKLDYSHFSNLILNAVAASRNMVDFDDICADLTISACHQGNPEQLDGLSLSENFRDDELKKILEDMKTIQETEDDIISAVQYNKMHKLFELWDQDSSGTIDFTEFSINLRKFQTTSRKDIAMQDTVESALAAMMVIDDNTDQSINRQEFATFLVKFARAANIDLYELIDFMIVRTILRDDNEAELAYLDKVKQRAEKKMSWLAPPSLSYNPDRWGG